MGKLTTHVLDTARGQPGSGIAVALYGLDGERRALSQAITNADGRCDAPLLEGESVVAGRYELVFSLGEYFRRQGYALTEPPFLDEVVLRFGIASSGQHYHVPLLVSPWSYSTYRGS